MLNYSSNRDDFSKEIDCILEIAEEKKRGNGEDSYAFCVFQNCGMVGVFDGCGGSGAKTYSKAKGKTGAYIGARVAAGAAMKWAKTMIDGGTLPENGDALKDEIEKAMKVCKDQLYEKPPFKSSMSKDFPTTMAMAAFLCHGEQTQVINFWTGDSRCYLLCESGLYQLTEDDLGGIDAMENITKDGVLTNVITATQSFTIHAARIKINSPCILFAATDGCFGYFQSPMAFEYMLLDTLENAESVSQWEEKITGILAETAGDDFTLTGAVINFGSFEKVKTALKPRTEYMYNNYIGNITASPEEQWEKYKVNYYRFCKR